MVLFMVSGAPSQCLLQAWGEGWAMTSGAVTLQCDTNAFRGSAPNRVIFPRHTNFPAYMMCCKEKRNNLRKGTRKPVYLRVPLRDELINNGRNIPLVALISVLLRAFRFPSLVKRTLLIWHRTPSRTQEFSKACNSL